jgi:hypothetical protein
MIPGDGSVMKHSMKGGWLHLGCEAFHTLDLAPDRARVLVSDLRDGLRRVEDFTGARDARAELLGEERKFAELLCPWALRLATEAGHALRHVSLEADAALLPVICDVYACFALLLEDRGDAPLDLGGQRRLINWPSELLLDQHFSQRFTARQAADMRHQDPILAALH